MSKSDAHAVTTDIQLQEPTEEVASSRRSFAALLGAFGAMAITGCNEESPSAEQLTAGEIDVLQQALTGTGTLMVADTAANLRVQTGTTTVVAVLQGLASAGDGHGGVFYWSTAAKADDDYNVLNAGSANSAGWRRTSIVVSELSAVLATRVGLADGEMRVCSGVAALGLGAGMFRWYAGDTSTAVTGMVLGSSSAGRWKRVVVRSITPQECGAVGNGVAPDEAALQTAVNFAIAEGLNLRLPAGTYKVTSTIVVSGNLEIHGDGPGTTFIDGGGNSALTILRLDCNPYRHYVLADLQFIGGGVQVEVSGGFMLRTSSIRNVTFYAYARKGLYNTAVMIGCSHFNLQFAAGGAASNEATYGIYSNGEALLHHSTWYNVRTTQNDGAGVWIGGAQSTTSGGNQGTIFHQLTAEGNAGHGIYVNSARVVLYNPYFEYNGEGVSVHADGGEGAVGFDVAIDTNYAGGPSVVRSLVNLYEPTFDTPHANQYDGAIGLNRRVKYMNQGVDFVLRNGFGNGHGFIDVNSKHISTTFLDNAVLVARNTNACIVQSMSAGHWRTSRMICVGSTPADSGIPEDGGAYGGAVIAQCSSDGGSTTRTAVYLLNLKAGSSGAFSANYLGGSANFVTFEIVSGKIAFRATDNTNVAVAFMSNL